MSFDICPFDLMTHMFTITVRLLFENLWHIWEKRHYNLHFCRVKVMTFYWVTAILDICFLHIIAKKLRTCIVFNNFQGNIFINVKKYIKLGVYLRLHHRKLVLVWRHLKVIFQLNGEGHSRWLQLECDCQG